LGSTQVQGLQSLVRDFGAFIPTVMHKLMIHINLGHSTQGQRRLASCRLHR
jgi:hypothetical protein